MGPMSCARRSRSSVFNCWGDHLSLRSGLDPDNPSLDGVISRVVQGVKIYDDPER